MPVRSILSCSTNEKKQPLKPIYGGNFKKWKAARCLVLFAMVVMHMGIFYCEAANSENSANVDRVCIGPLLDVIIAV